MLLVILTITSCIILLYKIIHVCMRARAHMCVDKSYTYIDKMQNIFDNYFMKI